MTDSNMSKYIGELKKSPRFCRNDNRLEQLTRKAESAFSPKD